MLDGGHLAPLYIPHTLGVVHVEVPSWCKISSIHPER